MRTLSICLLLGVLAGQQPVLGQVGGLPQAPPRDVRAEPQAGTASIHGRITAFDTGNPFRRTIVNLTATRCRPTPATGTGIVRGVTVDGSSGAPLAGIEIVLLEFDGSFSSNGWRESPTA